MDEFLIKSLSDEIGAVVGDVRLTLDAELGENYDLKLVEDSIRECLAIKIEGLREGMREVFTSPGRPEFHQLATIVRQRAALEREAEVEDSLALAEEFGDEGVFTGYRIFSKTKMAAMMEYLTAKGLYVYKTSLNKLLFYSDLTNYYLAGRGMSGAVYFNRRFGPVADPAAPILAELIDTEKVRVLQRTQSLEASVDVEPDILTPDERKVLDWVASTYGEMSASEVSEFSHREMAYKNTQPNEPIAYAYAQFLKQLPPRNLLDQ